MKQVILKYVKLEWSNKGNPTCFLPQFNKLDIQDFTYLKNHGQQSKSGFVYFK
jgi:hypothetical protein